MRVESGSSILDDTSTLAGSVLYTGGSDTSTVQGEVQVQIIDDFNDDVLQVDEVMKQFDDTIQTHHDGEEYSLKSVSTLCSLSNVVIFTFTISYNFLYYTTKL